MAFYINFYFKNLLYDDDYYLGTFSAPDNDVICEFEYNRHLLQHVVSKDGNIFASNVLGRTNTLVRG